MITTLVLLHGWGAGGAVWQRQTEYFRDRLAVLAPAIPVWEVGWLSGYLRELPLETCLVVGWSLGGMVLLEALAGRQGRPPGGVLLVGVAPVFCRRPDYPWGQAQAVVRAMRRSLKEEPGQVLAEFAAQCLAPGEEAFSSRAREAFASPPESASLAAGLDYLLTRDLRSQLQSLPAGMVIIQGEKDRIVPKAQGQFLHEQLPGARLHLLPGAGHLPFLTQAAAFNGILEECLNRAS